MTGHAETAFDFDSPVDRRNTASLKWDRYRGRDVLLLWVADMDFKAPPAVIAALHSHADHGVFGYTLPPDDLMEAVLDMLYRDQSWRVEPEWIVWLPGLVTGLNVACRAAGRPGDEVMTATPVYPPFLSAPVLSQRTLLT
ncbi:MAG TPA: aspartate aminotransferase, partial [Deltaproteobacteria bacterium]|nr:aspartate aminotransferase [Deltaproteobacteria bacterium]